MADQPNTSRHGVVTMTTAKPADVRRLKISV